MSCKYWNSPDKGNVDQDNNAVEKYSALLLNTYDTKQRVIYRETCGPSSLEAILEALGEDMSLFGILQPSDAITMLMHDTRIIHRRDFKLPVNRYLEAYPAFIKTVFPEIQAEVVYYKLSRDAKKEALREALSAPQTGCIINLTDPGHYIAGLHIDNNDMVYYNDSWMEDYWNKATTHKRSVHLDSLVDNVKVGFVKVWK